MANRLLKKIYIAGGCYLAVTLIIVVLAVLFPRQEQAEEITSVEHQSESNPRGIYISDREHQLPGGGIIAQTVFDEPAVYIYNYSKETPATLSLYKADKNAILNSLLHTEDKKRVHKRINISAYSLITELALNSRITENGERSRILLPINGSGIWIIRIKGAGFDPIDAIIIRSETAVLLKEGDKKFIFWGQDLATRKSITKGTIIAYSLENKSKEIAKASFGPQGIATLPISEDAEIALAQFGDETAFIPINTSRSMYSYSYRSYNQRKRLNSFLFTDRPLYRPDDVLYFKAILRQDDDAVYTVPKGKIEVKLFKEGESASPIYDKSLAISENGTIDGQITIPDTVSTGYYYLQLRQGSQYIGSTWLSIEYFRKPAYYIDISLDKPEYIATDKITCTIDGKYFSGQPLAGKVVRYKVHSSKFYEFTYAADLAYYSSYLMYFSPYYWYEDTVAEGTVTLNKQGKAVIRIDTALKKSEPKIFSIEAELVEETKSAYTRKNAIVYPGEYGIYRGNYQYSFTEKHKARLPLVLIPRKEGLKISNIRLKADFHRTEWVPVDSSGDNYPTFQKTEEDLPGMDLTSDGSGRALLEFVPEKSGSYKITLSGQDAKGNNIKNVFYLWISKQGAPSYYFRDEHENQNISLQLDKLRYNPGEKIKLTISQQGDDRDMLITFERARVRRYQIVHIKGNTAKLEFPVSETDIPNMFIKVSSFSSTQFETSNVGYEVSKDSKRLLISIKPDKKNYGPGDTVGIDIETTDMRGNPVSGELTLWAVDKAIFELVDDRPKDVFKRFWHNRYNGTVTKHSLQGISFAGAGERGGCFAAGTKILMADGNTKPIEDVKPGEMILTFKSEQELKLLPAQVTSVQKAEENSYLLINGFLKITSDHILWINNGFYAAGTLKIGDMLKGEKNTKIKVKSIEHIYRKIKVYNLEVKRYHTFFANGIWVHNQKAAQPRSTFKDTAYWNPSIETDAQGKAHVEFVLPDNLTTWVVSAIGITEDTRVGQNMNEIVVSKEVIIRPTLPNILYIDDSLVISADIQNYSEKNLKFDISLNFDSGSVSTKEYPNIQIKSKDTYKAEWRVIPRQENEKAKLTFSAISGSDSDLSDIIILEIPVRKPGFQVKQTFTGIDDKEFEFSLPPDEDQSKTSITLELSSTVAGTLPQSMRYLIGYPYGCVEQTTSRFVPVVIAKAHPELFADLAPKAELDKMIAVGQKRLKQFQHSDGGWSWWYSHDSDPFITAYVVEYLLLADDTGFNIDKTMLKKARGFFEDILERATRDNKIICLYALSLLQSEKGSQNIISLDNLDPDILALAVMHNIRVGEKDPEKNGLNRLIKMAHARGNTYYWDAGNRWRFGSRDASTALAIRAITYSGENRNTALQAGRFLMRNRIRNYWSNTFATAQVVRSLVELSDTADESSPEFDYTVEVNDKKIAQASVSDIFYKKQIKIPLDLIKNKNHITITKKGKGRLYSTLLINEFRTNKRAAFVNHGLVVRKEFQKVNGYGELKVGDTVLVKITLSGLKQDDCYGIIQDELPSGLVPVIPHFKNQHSLDEEPNHDWYYYDTEMTLNGAIISLYNMYRQEKVYTYKARVVSKGTFIVPPATASLMYLPEIYGRSNIQTLTIRN